MKLPIFPMATLVATLALFGCATPPAQVLDGMEPTAINAALERGRFELNCPGVRPRCCPANWLNLPSRRYVFPDRSVAYSRSASAAAVSARPTR